MKMDEILNKRKKSFPRPIISASVALVVIMLIGYITLDNFGTEVESDNLQIETVKRGNVDIVVKGFGTLRANRERVLTAAGPGTVEDILLYPGSEVQPDSVILSLSSPDLEQQLRDSELRFTQVSLELDEAELVAQSRFWEVEAEVKMLQLDVENQRFLNDALSELSSQGIISKFEQVANQTKLNKSILELELAQTNREQVSRINEQRQVIAGERIDAAAETVSLYKNRVEQNQVKAGISGILQRLYIELGESVAVGDRLALVGGTEELSAEIRLSQRDANQVQIGDKVEINTFGDRGTGTVSRIDPVVNDGRVLVEVNLTGGLPSNARPNMSVEGMITINRLEDVLYVRQIVNHIEPNSVNSLFVIDEDGQSAVKAPITFGDATGDYIEIVQGASEGDRLILQVPNNLQSTNSIKITQ